MSFYSFQKHLEEVKSSKLFKQWSDTSKDCIGGPSSPIELLLLGTLWYLGHGWTFDDLEESTANALADLPFDTLKSLVQKYPVSVSAGAMLLGYTLVRDPKTATRHAQRLLLGLL